MELEEWVTRSIEYLQSEPIIAVAILVIAALLLYFKTKQTLKILAILLAFAFLYYVATMIGGAASTGVLEKQKMVEQE